MYKAENRTTSNISTTSHASRLPHLLTGYTSLTLALLLALTLCLAPVPALAQGRIWQVDAQHSIARLSLGSGSQSAEIGVAPVTGNVVFDSSDPADPVVDLSIKPGNTLAPEYLEITFKSNRSSITGDGNLAVVGDLSVTHVERNLTLDPNEAYRGPEYGEPVVHTDTREVTLVFPAAGLPAPQNGAIQLSASTTIGREDFPQLLAELESGNRPSVVVEDENCAVPSTTGEDYSGPICTGTPVAIANNNVATNGGSEDYRGFEPAVIPNRNQATIALNLKLTQLAPTSSAASGATEPAGH